jgi:hypothetical protein
MDMSEEATTLMGREEVPGKVYPLWLERLFLLTGALIFVFFSPEISKAVDHALLGPLVAFVAFPLALLAVVEMAGRLLQASLTS